MNSLTSTDRVSQTQPFILLEAEIKENPLMIYGKTYFDNFHTYHLYLITWKVYISRDVWSEEKAMKYFPSGENFLRKHGGFSTLTTV